MSPEEGPELRIYVQLVYQGHASNRGRERDKGVGQRREQKPSKGLDKVPAWASSCRLGARELLPTPVSHWLNSSLGCLTAPLPSRHSAFCIIQQSTQPAAREDGERPQNEGGGSQKQEKG
jgi:hypothetical protein